MESKPDTKTSAQTSAPVTNLASPEKVKETFELILDALKIKSKIIFLIGDSGKGKTLLLEKLSKIIVEKHRLVFLRGKDFSNNISDINATNKNIIHDFKVVKDFIFETSSLDEPMTIVIDDADYIKQEIQNEIIQTYCQYIENNPDVNLVLCGKPGIVTEINNSWDLSNYGVLSFSLNSNDSENSMADLNNSEKLESDAVILNYNNTVSNEFKNSVFAKSESKTHIPTINEKIDVPIVDDENDQIESNHIAEKLLDENSNVRQKSNSKYYVYLSTILLLAGAILLFKNSTNNTEFDFTPKAETKNNNVVINAEEAELNNKIESNDEIFIVAQEEPEFNNKIESNDEIFTVAQEENIDHLENNKNYEQDLAENPDHGAEIANLLEIAEAQFTDKKLTTPQGNNAFETYGMVLDLDPNNKNAINGQLNVHKKYISWGLYYIQNGEPNRGKRFIRIANNLNITEPIDTSSFDHLINTELNEDETIENLLIKAEIQLQKNRLSTPVDDNAYSTYNRVLEFNPNNEIAKNGIKIIKEKYLSLAKQELDKNNSDNALEFYKKALAIDPDDLKLFEDIDKIFNISADDK